MTEFLIDHFGNEVILDTFQKMKLLKCDIAYKTRKNIQIWLGVWLHQTWITPMELLATVTMA